MSGQEMIEVAHILRRATPNSLVLLDEIGRGTSTFDGLAIAWSVTEDIAKRIGCRTLFATHYHQLVGLENEVASLANIHVQVADSGGEIAFLHTVADGPCDDSYGVQVASLAGLPGISIPFGKDKNGKKLASGLYFYQLEANIFIKTKKMIMIK